MNVLGAAEVEDTSWPRKNCHCAMQQGCTNDIKGNRQTQKETSGAALDGKDQNAVDKEDFGLHVDNIERSLYATCNTGVLGASIYAWNDGAAAQAAFFKEVTAEQRTQLPKIVEKPGTQDIDCAIAC